MTVLPEFSVFPSLRPALYFASPPAVLIFLLTGHIKAPLVIAASIILATFAVWPRRASQPLHAAVLIALLTNPIVAAFATLLAQPPPRPLPFRIHLQIYANATAESFLLGGALLVLLFPLIAHKWLTTPAPPPRL